MSLLTLVVVAGSLAEADHWRAHHEDIADDATVLDNSGAKLGGLASIGNHYLETSSTEVLGLCHADVAFSIGAPLALAQAALGRQCLAGIVGVTDDGVYIWSKQKEPGVRDVSTLDSCALFIPVEHAADLNLRFDAERFPLFHCVVEDFCLAAKAKGMRVMVPPGPVAEHPGTRWRGAEWQAGHVEALRVLRQKWTGPFQVT